MDDNQMAKVSKIFFSAGVLFVVGTFLNPFVTVPAGNKGIVTTFGKVSPEVLSEGLHLIKPIADKLVVYNIQIQKNSTAVGAASKDLQQVSAEVTVNYTILPEKVALVYQEIGNLDSVESRIISPAVQEVVKAATAFYNAEELITKRQEVREKIKVLLDDRLKKYNVVINEFSITNFNFSHSFNEAIEAKVTADQQKLKAQNDLARIKVEAEQKIATAQAEAESLKIQKQEVTSELIKLREVEVLKIAVDKWDGKLPTYMMGNSVPFVNVKNDAK